jgi:hypothetical protein
MDLGAMRYIVIKITIFILIAFSHSIFAKSNTSCEDIKDAGKWIDTMDDYYKRMRNYKRESIVANCDDNIYSDYIEEDPRHTDGFVGYYVEGSEVILTKKEKLSIYTNYNGTKEITKRIFCGDIYEKIVTKRDSADNLISFEYEVDRNGKTISSRLEVWKGNKLVRTKYNGILRGISQRKTPCELEVVEPAKGKTIYLVLDPKNKPDTLIQKHVIDSAEIYDAIKYYWYPHCKEYHEKNKADEVLKDTVSLILDAENDGGYVYAMIVIIIGTVVACVIIIRKKRQRKGNGNELL